MKFLQIVKGYACCEYSFLKALWNFANTMCVKYETNVARAKEFNCWKLELETKVYIENLAKNLMFRKVITHNAQLPLCILTIVSRGGTPSTNYAFDFHFRKQCSCIIISDNYR